ncbi:MAG: aspartyl/asparaginyl beta-hydroxylase domain-containing protein [Pseudomonadota bacterium]
MKLPQPFIRLPLRFDAARLQREMEALPAGAWMPHPSGQPGNAAVALISRNGGDNDDFLAPMRTTPHLARCPYHRQVMATFGEVLSRSRLMKLDAGCQVGLHVDFNYHWHDRVRVHVPVITNRDVRFHCGDQHVHMGAGECWLFDNWRRHDVRNDGDRDRVHLVIDLAGSSRFWRLVRGAVARGHAGQDRDVPYDPLAEPHLETEQFNSAPVMAPGEMDALVRELIADFSRHPDNDPQLVRRYAALLDDLTRDWRELWHRYGPTMDGLPSYRQLLERTAAALHPERRALVTASNGVGVNPVIMQRILRAALAPELIQPPAQVS